MKKKITLLVIFFVGINMYSQTKKGNNSKIRAARINFISEKLSLSPQLAKKFWPTYNNSRSIFFTLKRQKKLLYKNIDINTLNNEKALELVKQIESIDKNIFEAIANSNKQLLEVLSAKQFLVLKKSEILFKRKLLEQIKNNN